MSLLHAVWHWFATRCFNIWYFILSSSNAELSVFDRRQKREIRHLENEITKWQYLVDSVTGKLWLGHSTTMIVVFPNVFVSPTKKLTLYFKIYLKMSTRCTFIPLICNIPMQIHTWTFQTFLLGITSPAFDNQTLAVLRGRLVRYLMRSNEVSRNIFFPQGPISLSC